MMNGGVIKDEVNGGQRDDLRSKFTAHKTKWAQKSLALASLLSAWFCGLWHALSHSGRMLTSQLPHLSE